MCFSSSPVWTVLRVLGCVFIWITYLGPGADTDNLLGMISGGDQGGFVLYDLLTTLVIIFAIAALLLPLLLDFGLLEYVGAFFTSGLKNAASMWFGCLPGVMCIGTAALVVVNYTPIFNWLGIPFQPLFELFRVPDAAAASTMIVGFTDMFTPAIIIAGSSDFLTAGFPQETLV